MYDRADALHQQFLERVDNKKLPNISTKFSLSNLSLQSEDLLALFESQCYSRHMDFMARKLKSQGRGYYTIGSSGHEGNAAIARAFQVTDMAFLHYRSGAFMFERARKIAGINYTRDILLSLMASDQDPMAGGRHKVFGSLALNVPPQTSTIASHLPKAVGMAFSLRLVKELQLKSKLPNDSVVLCSFGDASVNHASALSAFNTASWICHGHFPLPIVFICEDNGLGISVPTPSDWIEKQFSSKPFLHYLSCNGCDVLDVYACAKAAEKIARQRHEPVFMHMHTERYLGHAGTDIESNYRSLQDIKSAEEKDPLLYTAAYLINFIDKDAIIQRYKNIGEIIEKEEEILMDTKCLDTAKKIMHSIIPPKVKKYKLLKKDRQACFGEDYALLERPRTLAQNINHTLTDLMLEYQNIIVLGEDVGKAGGVYHVTANLQKRFGPARVLDTLLDETSILGTAIGMAHNGLLPMPEIQFLAYYHNAEDQIRGEAATLPFFSQGQFTNPMVLRIPSFAYQKGFGGHFHNDNSISVLRDLPGVIVLCPSHPQNAPGLYREAMRLAQDERRLVIILEPIALYAQKDLLQQGDGGWLHPYNQVHEAYEAVGTVGEGGILLITYGNGHLLARQAQAQLHSEQGLTIQVMDLRCLAPLPMETILKYCKGKKNILIVDEGRRSGSLSEGLMANLMESLDPLPSIERITGEDCFIPLGDQWQCLLPSKDAIIKQIRQWS